MAILKHCEVRMQQREGDVWVDLGEFETTKSLRGASDSNRTNVLIKEGAFRIVISLGEHFSWMVREGSRDAMLFNFTCQKGFWFNEYPVLVLHPSCKLPDRKKRYNNIGYMAENPHTKRLEYILESVYTPLPDGSHARTTFSFKEVDEFFAGQIKGSGMYGDDIDLHSIRINVDFCTITKNTYREYRSTAEQNVVKRHKDRQKLFPWNDLEPQGILDCDNVVQKVEGPHYKPDDTALKFTFIYYKSMPDCAIRPDDIDVIDMTTNSSPSKSSISRRATLHEIRSTALSVRPWKEDFVPAANEEDTRNDPSRISASPRSTTDQENINGSHDDSDSDEADYKPQDGICTPPLNPTDGDEPVKSIPVLASTSAVVSNSVPDPLPTPTSHPMTARPAALGQSQLLDPRGVLEALVQDHSTLRANRQADILERQSDIDGKEHRIETNNKIIELNGIDIQELTARLASLQSNIDKKKDENETLEEHVKSLRDEISKIRKEGEEDEVAFKDAKEAYEVLRLRVKQTNRNKRRRSQVSLDSTPHSGGRRIRDCSSSAMQTDSD